MENVDIKTNARTTEVIGEDHVTGISYEDLNTGETQVVNLDGIFVQIGLVPNTAWLQDAVELNGRGEVVIDRDNATSLPGVFAAGDVTDQKTNKSSFQWALALTQR